MNRTTMLTIGIATTVWLAVAAVSAQDKYSVKVPGGLAFAEFSDYDAASNTFKPGTTAGMPPQANDAKCGFACHTKAKSRDYVFTEYGKR